MRAVALLLCLAPAQAQDLSGIWLGSIKAGVLELRLGLHISTSADGTSTAKHDPTDQGVNGLAMDKIALAERAVSFEVPTVRGSFQGTVNEGGTGLIGNWKQGPATTPLAFKKVDALPTV